MTSLLCSPFSGVGDAENITFDVHFDDENAKISVLRTIDRANQNEAREIFPIEYDGHPLATVNTFLQVLVLSTIYQHLFTIYQHLDFHQCMWRWQYPFRKILQTPQQIIILVHTTTNKLLLPTTREP
jgi:hypothetical protein